MTAERVNAPRWRRRRDVVDEVLPVSADLAQVPDAVEAPLAEAVPLHRPPLSSRNPITGGRWAGRASDHRRAQVRARGPEPVVDGPTGPVTSSRSTPADATTSGVDEVWGPVVEMLERDLGGLSAVLLCTTDGTALASHGIVEGDVATVAARTGAVFTSGRDLAATHHDIDRAETIQLSAGDAHTVIAAVPTGHGDLSLSVTADGGSIGMLLSRTRQAADDLHRILAAADD